ncbi:Uncharacterised protein [uncultured archaeon]|nr:Uncharacterised protein [uncultured archaeon]
MPVVTSYPGVYVEEIPSGVRTITGVATSITAFVGRTRKGPVNEPVVINSYSDYERIFGGLWKDSSVSYAVQDFYINGGSQAVIVRLYSPSNSTHSKSKFDVKGLVLEAANEGSWGDALRARVDQDVSGDIAKSFGLDPKELFNLTVRDTATGVTETFHNVTGKDSPRRIDKILKNESSLVRVENSLTPPFVVPGIHAINPPSGKTVWDDDTTSAGVKDAERALDSQKLNNSNDFIASRTGKEGIYALEKTDLFNLLCIPPDSRDENLPDGVYANAMKYCAERRAMLIVDPPKEWASAQAVKLDELGLTGTESRNAAVYFPRIIKADPLMNGQLDTFAPCGAVAGVISRTDVQRGVWKAPAGIDASIIGVQDLLVNLTDAENGMLNPLAVNCLRAFPIIGRVAWGARTLRGADLLADEYKYIPVRRLALYIEESLYRGLKWAVFEPNDEPLWAQIRLNAGAFMHNLFRQGAFQGTTPRKAYFVKCDNETTTQNDIDRGIVNIVVGFAPLKPAEFVILKIQQMAGEIQT